MDKSCGAGNAGRSEAFCKVLLDTLGSALYLIYGMFKAVA